MASNIYISEYHKLARDADGNIIPAGAEPALAEQSVAIGGVSVQSAAFTSATRFVRINADIDCCLLFGADPTAVSTKKHMAAGATEFFGVTPGDKVAVINEAP